MQFLGVGWQEMAVVLFLMLVFVGPERMPRVAYQIGRAVRTLQGYARAVRNEFSEEIAYVEEQYKTVRGEVDATRAEFREQQVKFGAEMREATAPLQELPAAMTELHSDVSNVVNMAAHADATSTPVTEALPAAVATTETPATSSTPPLVF